MDMKGLEKSEYVCLRLCTTDRNTSLTDLIFSIGFEKSWLTPDFAYRD